MWCAQAGQIAELDRKAGVAKSDAALYYRLRKNWLVRPLFNERRKRFDAAYLAYWHLAEILIRAPRAEARLVQAVEAARDMPYFQPYGEIGTRLFRRYANQHLSRCDDDREVLGTAQFQDFIVILHALTNLELQPTYQPDLFIRVIAAALNGDADVQLRPPENFQMADGERLLSVMRATLHQPERVEKRRKRGLGLRISHRRIEAQRSWEQAETAHSVGTFAPYAAGVVFITNRRIDFFGDEDLPPIYIPDVRHFHALDDVVVEVRHTGKSPARLAVDVGGFGAAHLAVAAIEHALRAWAAGHTNADPASDRR
jgi:hypothetical protein